MSLTCKYCGMSGLLWSENVGSNGKYYLYNENTGQKHECKQTQSKPKQQEQAPTGKIPLYHLMNGVFWPHKDDEIAHMITDNAVALKRDPWQVPERKGDFLILK